ncbi:hypothetical protein EYR36_008163 [Pleurotus pulmonarius]|nr:hypothetical protein EYR36_008163 [Pleurotus pulmonarius]
MYFNAKSLILLAITALTTITSAENIQYDAFASTVECSGAKFSCFDGGALCCALPPAFGFSVQFNNFAVAEQGQGYTGSTCGNFLFALFGPGTKCWNGGGVRATHANWFHTSGRRTIDPHAVNQNCTTPSSFTYHDELSGTERTIKVPPNGADEVAEFYVKKDFAKLASYDTY